MHLLIILINPFLGQRKNPEKESIRGGSIIQVTLGGSRKWRSHQLTLCSTPFYTIKERETSRPGIYWYVLNFPNVFMSLMIFQILGILCTRNMS